MTTLRIVLWVFAFVTAASGLSAYVALIEQQYASQPISVLAYRCGSMFAHHIIPDADELAMEARCEQARKGAQ